MANIRGLNDLPANNNNQAGQFTGQDGQIPNFLNNYMKAGALQNQGNPREEKFCTWLRNFLAPGLTMRSFITQICIVDILCWLLSDAVSIANGGLNPAKFLGPTQDSYSWFNKRPDCIKCSFQIYRLITPIVLHTGFSHIIQNLFSQIIFGGILELMVGYKHIAAIYFVSGIGGNLFSSVTDPRSPSIGASTSDFGILFGLLAMICVNWYEFKGQQLEQVRCMLMAIVIIMIIFNLMAGGAQTDGMGHLGGGICGMLWGLAFLPRVASPFTRKCQIIGQVGTLLMFVICISVLYLGDAITCGPVGEDGC